MDKLTGYRDLIKRLLTDLVALINQQHPAAETGVECLCLFDDQRDQYLLTNVGWSGSRRVRATTLYLRLLNGKIWIEEDMTEEGIANDLLREGVPRDDIVLAFQPPALRKHTEFAVA